MKRLIILIILLSILTVGLSAPSERVYVGAWPYDMPPVGHFNTFVSRAITLGIYYELLHQPFAFYYWATGKYEPVLATSWRLEPTNKPEWFIVNLRKGVKWSNGQEFTSKDVLATYYLGYLMNWPVWRYIDKVEASGKYTVKFHMNNPSSVVPRYILRTYVIRDYSTYGAYADKVMALLSEGKTGDSDEMKKLRAEFEQFRPRGILSSGPFVLDVDKMTEAEVVLTKNPYYWNAEAIQFDKVRLVNGETPTVTPMVLAKEVDYATHGFPPATEKQFIETGIRIIRPPIYSGPAIFVNHNIYPLNRVEVRQAMAYAINRDENGFVSLGKSGVGVKFMTGFSDNLVPLWISKTNQKKLNLYSYDPKKAEAILQSIGFKRDKDGVWIDDKGNRMEYELIVPAEYADWSAAAENAAAQLTKFGIKVTVRGVTFAQVPQEAEQGRFQLLIQAWGAGHPHPHFSFYQDLIRFNYPLGVGPGMNFPMKQKTKVVGEVDLDKLITDSAIGFDTELQKKYITTLALAFNELLPIIPLWERYGNNPALDGVRITGWPPEGDPIYKNSPYSDNFVIIMLTKGILKPVK